MNTSIFKLGDPKQYDLVLGIGFDKGTDKNFYLKMWRLQKKENIRTLMDVVNAISNGVLKDNINRGK